MYIEIDLEHDWYLEGIHGLLASIRQWSEVNNVRHQTKIVKHCLRLTFDDDKIYTWFIATWSGTDDRTNVRLVTQRNL